MDIKCGECKMQFRIPKIHEPSVGVKQVFTCCCPCEEVYAVSVSVVPINLKDRSYRDKENLNELYTNQGKTMIEIGMQYGVSAMTINNWLRKHDIPTRRRGRPPLW